MASMHRLAGRLTPFGRHLGLIAIAGLAVRLLYVLLVVRGNELTGDARYYHEAANLLADGLGFTEPYRYLYGGGHEYLFVEDHSLIASTANTELPIGHIEPTAGHPPLWVLLLGLASLLGVTSVLGHQLVSACVGVAGILLVGLLGRQVAGDRVGLLAAGIAAGYAFLWLNDGSIMSEGLVVALVAASTLVALRVGDDPSRRNLLVLGLLGGLAALTRAELLVALPLVALGVIRRRPPAPGDPSTVRCIGLLGLVGATALVVLSPWVVRNLVVFEEPVLLSNGTGILLAQANCDATYYGDKQGYCESQRDVVWRSRGLDYAGDHLARLLGHAMPRRVARVWALDAPVQQLRADMLVEGRSFRASVLGLTQYAFLVPAAVAGAVLLRRRRRPLLPLLAWPAIVTLVAAASMGTTRYRVSAEVTIVVLAAVAVDALLRYRRDRRGASTG